MTIKLISGLNKALEKYGDLDVIDKNLCDIIDIKYVTKANLLIIDSINPIKK